MLLGRVLRRVFRRLQWALRVLRKGFLEGGVSRSIQKAERNTPLCKVRPLRRKSGPSRESIPESVPENIYKIYT